MPTNTITITINSAGAIGVADIYDGAPLQALPLDSRDGLRYTDILPSGSFDNEFLPEESVSGLDARLEECFTSDCTTDDVCIPCLIRHYT